MLDHGSRAGDGLLKHGSVLGVPIVRKNKQVWIFEDRLLREIAVGCFMHRDGAFVLDVALRELLAMFGDLLDVEV